MAVIKPDAVASGMVEEILAHVESAGLEVLCKEERTLTREEAEEFYKQHEGSVSWHNDCARAVWRGQGVCVDGCVCMCACINYVLQSACIILELFNLFL